MKPNSLNQMRVQLLIPLQSLILTSVCYFSATSIEAPISSARLMRRRLERSVPETYLKSRFRSKPPMSQPSIPEILSTHRWYIFLSPHGTELYLLPFPVNSLSSCLPLLLRVFNASCFHPQIYQKPNIRSNSKS